MVDWYRYQYRWLSTKASDFRKPISILRLFRRAYLFAIWDFLGTPIWFLGLSRCAYLNFPHHVSHNDDRQIPAIALAIELMRFSFLGVPFASSAYAWVICIYRDEDIFFPSSDSVIWAAAELGSWNFITIETTHKVCRTLWPSSSSLQLWLRVLLWLLLFVVRKDDHLELPIIHTSQSSCRHPRSLEEKYDEGRSSGATMASMTKRGSVNTPKGERAAYQLSWSPGSSRCLLSRTSRTWTNSVLSLRPLQKLTYMSCIICSSITV